MNNAQLFVKCLENEGVEYIFGVPGEETLHLMDSLSSSSIKFIPTRHEQGAAFIADVYGRVAGKAGVCLATLGPGATNLITGIADANMDGAPLVAITGQSRIGDIHKSVHQYIDIVEMFKPITKWNARVTNSTSVPEIVRKAFKIAQTEKMGATHIELPKDIAALPVAENLLPLQKIMVQQPLPNEDELRKAARIIRQARFPVLLVGHGVNRRRASVELKRFVEQCNIPVATTFMGKGAFPFSHPLCFATVGLQVHDIVACGLDRADVIIAVGYDYEEYGPKSWNPDRDKTIIHISANSAEVDAFYQTEVELVGDIRQSLLALGELLAGSRQEQTYTARLKEIVMQELESYQADYSAPMKPQKLIYDLRRVLLPKDILISDVGAHKMWISRMYPAEKQNTVIISNGFATMGIALPGAIGAKLAKPNRRVIAVSGDGGFLMNLQELETAVRLRLALVIIVVNDGSYGLIKWKQEERFGRHYGVEFGNPDFVSCARSFGANSVRVDDPAQFATILEQALQYDGVTVLDVPIDYSENMKLTKKLGEFVCPL